MVSTQNKQMAQFFASVTERMSRSDLDLATIRDVYESLHLAASEPEGVCYAEVDIDGVPALWCIPADCDHNRACRVMPSGRITRSTRGGWSQASCS